MAETRDHIRALADLYLTGGQAIASAPEPRQNGRGDHRPLVEIILVGHLPVRAGLWLTQYADDVAREEGATALLRLDTEQVILEILRGSESAARASAASTLNEAIACAGPQVRRWILRPAVEERVTSLLEAEVDVITILSGADEAAIVAAYRTIKELFDAASRIEHPLPAIELAILGADPVAARQAAESIRDTAQLHMGLSIPLRRSVRAMGSLGSTLHFRFPSEHAMSLDELVKTLSASFGPVADTNGESSMGSELPPIVAEELEVRTESQPLPRMRSLVTPIGHRGFSVPAFDSESREEAPAMPKPAPAATSEDPIRLRPKLGVQVEPKQFASRAPGRAAPPAQPLATWIEGLALLQVRCPDAPEVEIAVDATGGLHVLAWEDRLRALTHVTVWLRKHRELVSMACLDYRINTESAIICHLVTSEPRRVADLHGSDLRLHVLAPVEVEGKCGWFSAVLSE